MEEQCYLDKDRIPVFIGKSGSQKRAFEKKFACKIDVNSKTGEVVIDYGDDSVAGFVLANIVHAVNYGHSPEHAMQLENETFVIDTIDVKDYVKDSRRLKVVMGRIIGKEGSTRKVVEDITKCSISVKDHFVSVIGPYENTLLVHEALSMLIKGASHKSLYSYLERNKSQVDSGLL